jgi:hypothetical protein
MEKVVTKRKYVKRRKWAYIILGGKLKRRDHFKG